MSDTKQEKGRVTVECERERDGVRRNVRESERERESVSAQYKRVSR